ncbi:hypothetical protein P775_11215 [Puniceibacterium antarcticum]|uniref:Uncharacterized protein n=1 Tax=Puniceibacterium antarcticum TaxID=1206336 RepID=A0A2G8RF54_9RHOB|nr:hypothetical protein [Puniceibacterium antarcticum]PIL20224.1 hypothetical protein P775_11215 [Puniceibacterium antarcticum]
MSEVYDTRLQFSDSEFDLKDYLREALDKCPVKLEIDFDLLVSFAVRRYHGNYIKAHEWKGLDEELVNLIVGRAISWAWSEARIEQIIDLDFTRWFRFIEFRHDVCACSKAKAMNAMGLFGPESLARIPLDGCWLAQCACEYRTISKRDLKDRGLENLL